MLMDAVGSWLDDGYCYYLKHRTPGQVDAEGKPASTVLGAVNIRGDWDAFSFKICGADRDMDFGPYYDFWDGDFDWGVSNEERLWAVWTFSKRAVLYSDHEMTNQIGWLDITGSGTWYEYEEERVIHDTDDDGNDQVRYERERRTDCKTQGFRYKFNVFNTPMHIAYSKSGGGFWTNPTLSFKASNAWDTSVPLFTVQGDGERNCSIETFPNADPISTLLAAYAISCKLDPKDFGSAAHTHCERHMRLGMWPGTSNFIGMTEQDFEQSFTKYPAPVPQVFAAAVASYQPQAAAGMAMAQPAMMQQPMMAQPGMAMAQPMMAQPGMAVAQPMAVAAQPHPFLVAVPQGMGPGQQVLVQSPNTGAQVAVVIPQGMGSGMQFQVLG